MTQPSLFKVPDTALTHAEQARAAGEKAMQRVTQRAEDAIPGFLERARELVLAHLKAHGEKSSEELTNVCIAAGLNPPNPKAFGGVYRSLSARKEIVQVGWCDRVKGHGTSGGRIWDVTR